MVPRRLSLACGSRQEVSSDSALSGDEDLNDDEKKIKKERRRKARNQRRYYRKYGSLKFLVFSTFPFYFF